MAIVLGTLIVVFVLIGIPMLCRIAVRRMGASQGLRAFLNAYGPRFPIPGPKEPDDKADTDASA